MFDPEHSKVLVPVSDQYEHFLVLYFPFDLCAGSSVNTEKPILNYCCSNLESLKKKVESGVFDDDEDDVMILEDVPPCTPESQKEINVKVRSRTGIQRFLMKRVPV